MGLLEFISVCPNGKETALTLLSTIFLGLHTTAVQSSLSSRTANGISVHLEVPCQLLLHQNAILQGIKLKIKLKIVYFFRYRVHVISLDTKIYIPKCLFCHLLVLLLLIKNIFFSVDILCSSILCNCRSFK